MMTLAKKQKIEDLTEENKSLGFTADKLRRRVEQLERTIGKVIERLEKGEAREFLTRALENWD